MIIFNNTNDLINGLEVENETLKFYLRSMKKTKNILLNYIQNFADSNSNINLESVDSVTNFLTSLKNSLNLCNENVAYIESLISHFNVVLEYANNNITEFKEALDAYNTKYIDLSKYIIENSRNIDNCLCDISKKTEIKFQESTNKDESTEIQVSNVNYDSLKKEEPLTNSNTSSEYINNKKDTVNCKYTENTLIISERNGNVILPYTISELNTILDQNPNKFFSIDSIISKKYTLPIKNFKNSFVSRFRETYKLMRHREKASIRDALDLGLELMFNYKLHPAIISACKNLEELDTYLDYLELGNVDKFDYFKIIFELPLAVHSKL